MSRSLLRGRPDDDGGFSLILVVGFSLIMMILITVAVSITSRTTDASRRHSAFDASLDVAEAGIDEGLARLQQNNAWTAGTSVPSTGFPACASPGLTAEQCWAKTQLQALAAVSTNLQKTGEGQFVVYKPANRQTVYAMGWTPSYASANAKWRMIKSEYLFGPYEPTNALLTGCNLNLAGSTSIDSVDGTLAAVHSNCNINSVASDTIQGPYSASGTNDCAASATNSGDCTTSGAQTPLQTVPSISALWTYKDCLNSAPVASGGGGCAERNPGLSSWSGTTYTGSWFDLCPDGSVRTPNVTTFVPCDSLNTTVLSASGTFRGWTWAMSGSVPTWTMGLPDSPYSGIYYVHYGDANIGTSGSGTQPWNGTVIAEAQAGGVVDPSSCNKLGGNISWKLFDLTAFMPGLLMLGDADVAMGANNQATGGAVMAGDQLHMSTSSATLTGSLVAGDQCVGSPADVSRVQGITLHYDETGQAPVQTVINTTLWLEYAG